jgi:6-pyruvoyltetrahydropterin/6-carboxytetrahydropterin synthase
MFEVVVETWFAAAHQLRLPDGSLEPLHGHNWQVRVTYAGRGLNGMGVLVDFGPLRQALQEVIAPLHDQHLNELPAFAERNPSAEYVAVHIAERLAAALPDVPGPACVEVEEEPGCFARYYPAR